MSITGSNVTISIVFKIKLDTMYVLRPLSVDPS